MAKITNPIGLVKNAMAVASAVVTVAPTPAAAFHAHSAAVIAQV